MLFHIKQTHAPADCPFGSGGSRSLFDNDHPYVTVHGFWLAFPQHTNYLGVPQAGLRHHDVRDHSGQRPAGRPQQIAAPGDCGLGLGSVRSSASDIG